MRRWEACSQVMSQELVPTSHHVIGGAAVHCDLGTSVFLGEKNIAGIFQAFSHIWLVVVDPDLYCPKRRMVGNFVSITTPAFIFLDLFFGTQI